ncbi:hypothetical protein OVA13_12165 [Pseudoxanthomonas sp. SL93]|uniref:hypothetical protein n=1 Tax=Pseudoxanthomonas sp. SL93 TaxID=2995142 RepID=UPI00226FA7C7|nr:hypothetical protein [Pseudoxanthomonas sp. SL93]WAC62157.1 hypothetical protein OVA13_12165 [Pseudoxanthomonas sp. SL93]
MTRGTARHALIGALLLVAAPVAFAQDDCTLSFGRGWPPATGNHGAAVEQLFTGDVQPAVSLVWLPATGKERGIALIPGAEGAAWTLRVSEADERVHVWSGGSARGGVQFRTEQTPDRDEVRMPVPLAQRVASLWQQALERAAPQGVNAPLQDRGLVSFLVNGERFSGVAPDCGPAELLFEQVDLLVEASNESESKQEKRWQQLDAALDELQQSLSGQAPAND